MSKTARTKRSTPRTEIDRFVEALRYLQHEAGQASLDKVVAALAHAERAVTLEGSHENLDGIKAGTDEAELVRQLTPPTGAGRAERRFRLQALTEISTSLSTEQLIQFAYVCDAHAAHLIGFLELFVREPESLACA